jgi:uncharacterized protein YPO0396
MEESYQTKQRELDREVDRAVKADTAVKNQKQLKKSYEQTLKSVEAAEPGLRPQAAPRRQY